MFSHFATETYTLHKDVAAPIIRQFKCLLSLMILIIICRASTSRFDDGAFILLMLATTTFLLYLHMKLEKANSEWGKEANLILHNALKRAKEMVEISAHCDICPCRDPRCVHGANANVAPSEESLKLSHSVEASNSRLRNSPQLPGQNSFRESLQSIAKRIIENALKNNRNN